jgi:hypothetical protein
VLYPAELRGLAFPLERGFLKGQQAVDASGIQWSEEAPSKGGQYAGKPSRQTGRRGAFARLMAGRGAAKCVLQVSVGIGCRIDQC